jgi:hypothetical protein
VKDFVNIGGVKLRRSQISGIGFISEKAAIKSEDVGGVVIEGSFRPIDFLPGDEGYAAALALYHSIDADEPSHVEGMTAAECREAEAVGMGGDEGAFDRKTADTLYLCERCPSDIPEGSIYFANDAEYICANCHAAAYGLPVHAAPLDDTNAASLLITDREAHAIPEGGGIIDPPGVTPFGLETPVAAAECPDCGGSGVSPDTMDGPEPEQVGCLLCAGHGRISIGLAALLQAAAAQRAAYTDAVESYAYGNGHAGEIGGQP